MGYNIRVVEFDPESHSFITKDEYIIPSEYVEVYNQVFNSDTLITAYLNGEKLSDAEDVLYDIMRKLAGGSDEKNFLQKLLNLTSTYPKCYWDVD